MPNYRDQFAQELQRSSSAPDPIRQQLEAEINKPSGQNIAPTLGLVDHLTGSNFAAQAPKVESTKDKLMQMLQLRQGDQSQKLGGLKALAGMQGAAEDKAMQREFQEKMYGLQLMKANQKANAAPKLGSEDKAKLGYANEGILGIDQLRAKIKAGMGISPDFWANNVHDNEVNNIRRAIAENYGRMQSGGAISGDEESRFGHLIGNWNDNPELVLKKLDALQGELKRKASLYGGGGVMQASRMPSAAGGGYHDMNDAELRANFEASL
jgi:hypothetical protein